MSKTFKIIQIRLKDKRSINRQWYAQNALDTLTMWSKLNAPSINSCWSVKNTMKNRYTVYRKVYEWFKGDIPEYHELHHTCCNKWCVNPRHLKPLTRDEHMKEHARLREINILNLYRDLR